MRGYREVFKPSEDDSADPGRIFYTITRKDIGKRVLDTTAGPISLGDVIGYVLPNDVGKRLVRVQNEAKDSWLWQCESNEQRDARLAKKEAAK